MTETAPASTNNRKKEKPAEFNPRWKGYIFIGLSSLVNFCSISNIPKGTRRSYWAASMAFGLLTFLFSALVLLQDRSQKCLETLHYTKANKGYFEGYSLVFTVIWWIVGVAYTTKAGGIAYVASNIYYSSWCALFSCVFTLNAWSASKDILSIAELTGVSATLKSWYIVLLSSLIVLGTCIDLEVRLDNEDNMDDTAFGIAMGVCTSIVAMFFILVHYDFIPQCEEGGWFELSSSFLLIMLWTVGLAVFTQDQGIAATLTGTQCSRETMRTTNCTIIVYEENEYGIMEREEIPCSDLPRQVPGSNLYWSVWVCFLASLNVSFRWKAAQAMQFAQAQEEEERKRVEGTDGQALENQEDDDDDDDDV